MKNISRRNFLGQASCAAIGSTAFLSSALNLGMINTLSARPHILNNSGDYKAMVCILLAGGADSFNMLVPTDTAEFNAYQDVRGSLALEQNDLLPITPHNTNGRTFGIHGGMTRARDLFNADKLSFISNIGTLVEPIANLNDLESGNRKLPLGLFSHSDQIMQWQTSVPQSRTAVGIGGRMADILNDMQTTGGVSMNISLAGKNRFQAGKTVVEFALSNTATPDNLNIGVLPGWGNAGYLAHARDNAIGGMVEDVYSNIFQDTYSGLTRQTFESTNLFKTALAKKPDSPATFSDTRLSQDMRMISEMISVQQHLGNNRQIFFTTFGGWDHHDEVLGSQGQMLPVLSDALGEFYDALAYLGKQDDVVTFTISDFGRTLSSNGNGSDHAWGGNQLIMGGAVDGGKIQGTYPSLQLANNPLNIDERGRLIPTTSVDEFYAELALWFGVSPNDLNYILPNLSNFYSPQPLTPDYAPIGLFA